MFNWALNMPLELIHIECSNSILFLKVIKLYMIFFSCIFELILSVFNIPVEPTIPSLLYWFSSLTLWMVYLKGTKQQRIDDCGLKKAKWMNATLPIIQPVSQTLLGLQKYVGYKYMLRAFSLIVSVPRRRRDIKIPLCLSAPVQKSLI